MDKNVVEFIQKSHAYGYTPETRLTYLGKEIFAYTPFNKIIVKASFKKKKK